MNRICIAHNMHRKDIMSNKYQKHIMHIMRILRNIHKIHIDLLICKAFRKNLF